LVRSVERTMAILESLSVTKRGLTLAELSRRLGLPRSSTHCVLLTLEQGGFLTRSEQTHRYMFGLKLFSLANMALNGTRLREQASPFLQRLMWRCKATVHLAVLDCEQAVIIEKFEHPNAPRVPTWVGKRLDLHSTAVVKALIAHLPEEKVLSLVRGRGLPRYNENTITSFRRLQQELEETRRRGFSVDEGEDEIGGRCVGAPIFVAPGEVIAAVSIAGSSELINPEDVTSFGTLVKETSSDIAAALHIDRKTKSIE